MNENNEVELDRTLKTNAYNSNNDTPRSIRMVY